MHRFAARFSSLSGAAAGKLLLPFAIAFIGYQMVTVWVSLHGSMQHYVVHLTGVLGLAGVIAVADAGSARSTLVGQTVQRVVALAALVAALTCGWYLYRNIGHLEIVQPFIDTQAMTAGVLLIASAITMAWLLWGWPLALLCLGAIGYFALAHLIPARWAPSETSPNLLVSTLAGFGGPRGTFRFMPLSADMIFLLLVYGGFLYGCGVIRMFADVGRAIGNWFRGGIAYSALVASSLIGMVTGQAVSNIALSGSMTIPSMRQSGFTREQAGAIEVLASTGSQLLPPIMGLGAFLMAEILGVAYFEIVKAGLIPGLLFVGAILIGTYSLIGASDAIPYERQEVDWGRIVWVAPSFLISLGILVGLLYLRYSPAMAGFLGVTSLLILTWFRPKRLCPNLEQLADGVKQGIRIAIYLALMLAVIGIVVQTLSTTGAGISLGRGISMIGGESLGLTLLIAMAVSLLIGMGLPTPAAYALIAIVVVPTLIDTGLAPLTANMFGFYFAIMSTLTPPIAVGVLTAIRISGGTFWGTAAQCFMLGSVCFLIPYAFVASPTLLRPELMGIDGVVTVVMFVIATALMAGAIYGFLGTALTVWERLAAVVFGPFAYLTYLLTEYLVIGALAVCVPILWWVMRRRVNRDPGAVGGGRAPVVPRFHGGASNESRSGDSRDAFKSS